MTFEAFIRQAWTDHNDRAAEVGERLKEAQGMIDESGHVPALARIVAHVFGEHLAKWDDGIALLTRIKAHPQANADAIRSVDQGIAALQVAAGGEDRLDRFSPSERVVILGTASSALVAQRRFERAIRLYDDALSIAESRFSKGDPALRALAIGGNNLAAALETKNDRDAAETRAMVNAAAAGVKYWTLAGTWVETERAEYRMARSFLAAGQESAAVPHARRCLEICEANDAPAFERFLACAALAVAQLRANDVDGHRASRDAALRWHERIPAEERRWCESEMKELAEDVVTAAIRAKQDHRDILFWSDEPERAKIDTPQSKGG